jgi:hypothetical protein
VAGGEAGAVREPGVIATDQTDLVAIVTLARPEFKAAPAERRRKLLEALGRLNPQIRRGLVPAKAQPADSGQKEALAAFFYSVPKGEPVLVPSLEELERRSNK